MNQRVFSKIALGICLSALAIVSCTKKEEATKTEGAATSAPASDKIILGHFASLTGDTASFGVGTRKGVDLAMKLLNAAGGINGKQVEVITYDDQSKPEEASTMITKLITQDNVLAVLGEVSSKLSIVAADVAMRYKTPMVSSASTNPAVTQKGDYIFRICFIDPFQGEVMAKFAKENLKAKTAAIIRDVAQDYSVGLADFFKKAFEAKGGIILTDTSYQTKDTDFKAQLTEIKAKKPDVIFVPGYYNDVALILKQARGLGIKTAFMGGDGWESEDLVKVAGKEALEGTYYSNHYAPDTKDGSAQNFIAAYKKEYNGEVPDGMAALGFDAFNVVVDAIKRTKSTTRDEVRSALADTKNYKGVTGEITIDKDRNATKSAVVLKFSNGQPKYFATVNP
ncbi:MAG TPA: ABC transporter substrate-binding protein [Bdellovibrionota bacterium]|jgi:branched-chain amino acid transport system substrate-binding protein